jgi:translation initiation factor 2 subunit 2
MDNYEKLLENAYKTVKVVEKSGGRFELPKVQGHVTGNNTFITNFVQIADYIRRDKEHLAKFLQKELAVAGRISGNHLILKTKLNSEKVNDKIVLYAKEFVICQVCGKPDTEVISDRGVKCKHCLACGAKSPIRYQL